MKGMRYAEAIKIVKECGDKSEIGHLYWCIVIEKHERNDNRNAAFMAAEAVKDLVEKKFLAYFKTILDFLHSRDQKI